MIDKITALEIFSNPRDLEIFVGKDRDSGKFAVCIFRGPGHDFKPLITSKPFAETLESVITKTEEILEIILQISTDEFCNKESLIARILNPDGQDTDQFDVLDHDLIVRIIEELRQHQVASTYKMQVVPK